MMSYCKFIILLLAFALPVATNAAAKDEATTLTVFAAASLKESMDEATAAYQQATGQTVRVSYAASSALARQIEQGAPADVFISADLDWMDELQQHQLIDTSTRRNLLSNTLVLIAPRDSSLKPLVLAPGVNLLAMLGERGRLALALTESVPAGKYAKAALMALDIWPALQTHVAEAENVRAALLLVARGEAPLGVVYGSDAIAESRVRTLATFPANTHPAIIYPVAQMTSSEHSHAADFVRWLQTPAASAVFRRHGFVVL